MNCKACRGSLVPYLEKASGAPAAEIERHLAECDACRGEAAAVRALRDRMVRLGEAAGAAGSIEQPVMDRIAQHVQGKQEGEPMMTICRRLFAHPWRLSAASIVFAALVGAALILVGRGDRYAFGQTVEAQKNVRSVHVQVEKGALLTLDKDGTFGYPPESGPTEMWIEIGEDGKPSRVRMDMPWSPAGPKTIFWQDGKASAWLHSKNLFATINDTKVVSDIPKLFLDPNSFVTTLDQRVAAGKAQLTQVKTFYDATWSPKVMVANSTEADGAVTVYLIDPKTKFLQQVEMYKKHGNELVFTKRILFTQYNEPIPASVFEPAIPADAMRLDWTKREIGLAQGKMTEPEVSEAVTRQFFDCLIANDYDKASAIVSGVPVDKLKKSA